MKTWLAAAFILWFGITVAAQELEKPLTGEAVKGSGCLEPAVETGCKVVRDAKTGVLYNLFFSSKNQPAFDTAISFEGTVHDGPTVCMQGKAVNVTSWTKIRMHCPAKSSEGKQ